MGDGLRIQESVQEGLNRRAWCSRVHHALTEVGHHLVIGHLGSFEAGADLFQAHRRKVLWLHRLHVRAGSLDEHELHLATQQVGSLDLGRGIAAAPEYESLVLAHETRHVDEMLRWRRTRLCRDPAVLHERLLPTDARNAGLYRVSTTIQRR